MRLTAALACACLAAAAGAEEPEEGAFGRNGFYIGAGASFAFPMGGWSDGVRGGMNKTADASAEDWVDENLPGDVSEIAPVHVTTQGLTLDDARFGFGGVVGYRFSPLASLEIEGEWLADNGTSNFTITDSGDTGTASVKDLWTLTANLRVFPLKGGRFQPFGVFGVGLAHSTVDIDVVTSNLTTEADLQDGGMVEVPANFEIAQNSDSLDGAIRAGLGLDTYLTESVAAEIKCDYVIPFSDNNFVSTQYLSLRVGLLYRF